MSSHDHWTSPQPEDPAGIPEPEVPHPTPHSAEASPYGPPPHSPDPLPWAYPAPRATHSSHGSGRVLAGTALAAAVLSSALTLAGMALVSGPTPPPTTTPQITAAGTLAVDAEAIGPVLDSVFTVAVTGNLARGTGSGVAIDARHIVTNAHVVNLDGAEESTAKVEVQNALGEEYAATVVGMDTIADVAVLRVEEGVKLRPVAWGDSSTLSVGQGVIAVGAPLGLSNTVTSGIVSSLNRPVELSNGDGTDSNASDAATYINAIQTDAAINSGNSGGALIDTEGRLVGLNVAISTDGASNGSIGIGYAIPAAYVKRVAQELIKTGTASHGLLGVEVSTTGSGGGNFENGALVGNITAGGAADKSSLRSGDVIVAWDGEPVASAGSLIGFTKAAAPGEEVVLTVRRGSREIGVELVVGSDKA